jgi:hypothetical protein
VTDCEASSDADALAAADDDIATVRVALGDSESRDV